MRVAVLSGRGINHKVIHALKNAALEVLLVNEPSGITRDLTLTLRQEAVPRLDWDRSGGKQKAQWKQESRRHLRR